jgi:hypothetical protein
VHRTVLFTYQTEDDSIWKASIQPDDHNDRNGGGNERRGGGEEMREEIRGVVASTCSAEEGKQAGLRRQNGPFLRYPTSALNGAGQNPQNKKGFGMIEPFSERRLVACLYHFPLFLHSCSDATSKPELAMRAALSFRAVTSEACLGPQGQQSSYLQLPQNATCVLGFGFWDVM